MVVCGMAVMIQSCNYHNKSTAAVLVKQPLFVQKILHHEYILVLLLLLNLCYLQFAPAAPASRVSLIEIPIAVLIAC